MSKKCRVCHAVKPLEEFPRNARSQDGHNGICGVCQDRINARRASARKAKSSEQDPESFKRKVAKYLWQMSRRRARAKGLEHTIEPDDIVVPDLCPILQVPLNRYRGGFDRTSYSLDRIDSSRGYVKGNCRVISWRANAIKSSLTLEELERMVMYMKGTI